MLYIPEKEDKGIFVYVLEFMLTFYQSFIVQSSKSEDRAF